jgi:hypothetical protein
MYVCVYLGVCTHIGTHLYTYINKCFHCVYMHILYMTRFTLVIGEFSVTC